MAAPNIRRQLAAHGQAAAHCFTCNNGIKINQKQIVGSKSVVKTAAAFLRARPTSWFLDPGSTLVTGQSFTLTKAPFRPVPAASGQWHLPAAAAHSAWSGVADLTRARCYSRKRKRGSLHQI
jgi:hypothetical protein